MGAPHLPAPPPFSKLHRDTHDLLTHSPRPTPSTPRGPPPRGRGIMGRAHPGAGPPAHRWGGPLTLQISASHTMRPNPSPKVGADGVTHPIQLQILKAHGSLSEGSVRASQDSQFAVGKPDPEGWWWLGLNRNPKRSTSGHQPNKLGHAHSSWRPAGPAKCSHTTV